MRVMVIGAHPDDAEFFFGGTSRKFIGAGHEVKFVVVTHGDAGHQTDRGGTLRERRLLEMHQSARLGGHDFQALNHHDGRFVASIEVREEFIGVIRSWRPDVILTHRPCDYHPDHRQVAQTVIDAAYLLTVPSIVPRVPEMTQVPFIGYLHDDFTKPLPFEPDIVVSIDETIDDKIAMLDCHASQVYEWLPHNAGRGDEVPIGINERKEWLGKQVRIEASRIADEYRYALEAIYGAKQAGKIQYAEAFEASEYGLRLTADLRKRLFPFSG